MSKEEIKMFKLVLKRDYPFLLYKIEDIRNDIELLYHRMSGDKAISYGEIKGTTNQQAIEEYKLDLSEEIAYAEMQMNIYQARLDDIIKVLDKLQDYDREMFELKYRKHKSLYEIGKIYYLSASAISKRMNKALEEI